MYKEENKLHYEWSDYQEDIKSIDWLKFHHVIGIYRGSLPIATHISNTKNVPMSIIGFQTRDNNDKKPYWIHNAILDKDFTQEEKTILIVDDIYDTGNTINKVKEFIESSSPTDSNTILGGNSLQEWNKYPPRILTYCLFGKDAPEGTDLVYTNVHEEGDWVVFPWER